MTDVHLTVNKAWLTPAQLFSLFSFAQTPKGFEDKSVMRGAFEMTRKRKWKPGGRPRSPVKMARGNLRQVQKAELRHLYPRKGDNAYGTGDELPALGAGGNG